MQPPRARSGTGTPARSASTAPVAARAGRGEAPGRAGTRSSGREPPAGREGAKDYVSQHAPRRRGGYKRGEAAEPHAHAGGQVRAQVVVWPPRRSLMRPQDPLQGGFAAELPALDALKQRACESVELNAARLGALSRDIWSRPELAYEERQAHDTMTRFFSSGELPGAAWAVQPRYKLGTAFRADWGTAAPQGSRPLRLAFLCEYDALPGIGHACGHNLIAEVGAAAALGLKAALESLPQPAPVAVQVRGLPGAEVVTSAPSGPD